MSASPLLLGAGLAFWGWQTGNFAVGAVLALLFALQAQARLRLVHEVHADAALDAALARVIADILRITLLALFPAISLIGAGLW